MARLLEEYKDSTSQYGEALKNDGAHGYGMARKGLKKGTSLTGDIFRGTHPIAKKKAAFAGKTLERGWRAFVQGYFYLGERTEEDWRGMRSIPGDYWKNLKKYFTNIRKVVHLQEKDFWGEIGNSWQGAF